MRKLREYNFEFNEKWVSNNDFYGSKHWAVRHGLKKKYAKIFTDLTNGKIKSKMDLFSIEIIYNSRLDVDNVVGGAKIFVDTLKNNGHIVEDNKKYYIGLNIQPDWIFGVKSKTNTYNIKVIEWQQEEK